MSNVEQRAGWGQLTAGLIVAAIGLVLLMGEADILGVRDLFRLWPLIVIGIGASRIFGGSREEEHGGFVLLFIGIWLLINSLHLFGLFWHNSWPLAMVAVGLGRLLGSRGRVCRAQGLFLVLLGSVLQAAMLGLWGLDLESVWPLALVALGLWIILRAVWGGGSSARCHKKEVRDESL